MICSACGYLRQPTDLLAFWPHQEPARRRFVCRPTCPSSRGTGPCFAQAVATAAIHGIELVVPLERLAAPTPVRPWGPGWSGLLEAAGVQPMFRVAVA